MHGSALLHLPLLHQCPPRWGLLLGRAERLGAPKARLKKKTLQIKLSKSIGSGKNWLPPIFYGAIDMILRRVFQMDQDFDQHKRRHMHHYSLQWCKRSLELLRACNGIPNST